MPTALPALPPLVSTGIAGLDSILLGGLPADRLYLVEGNPGAGKTTLGLQFLLEGVRQGEPVLYVTLSETRPEIEAVASSHGWSLDGVLVHELSGDRQDEGADPHYTLFHPSDVELGETTKAVLEKVVSSNPVRVVFDSLSEMRLLARDPLRYRRQILGLKQYFAGRRCTVLLLDDGTADASDLQLRSLAHGVLTLERVTAEFGAERRRLRVLKIRGRPYRGGYHDFVIGTGGLQVFPRLSVGGPLAGPHGEKVSSGVPEMDVLVGGGLERGTSALLLGPAGCGKSTLATQYAVAAAARGERAALFVFDENREILLARAASTGMPLAEHLRAGRISLEQVDPGEISPGEFIWRVVQAAQQGARVVVIDSLNGYLNAMPEERFLTIQLHEVLSHLGHLGVLTLLVAAQHGLLGESIQSPVDVSYLADSVILLRYFEAEGHVRQAISVLKKRTGQHERTIHEFHISSTGVRVGPPLLGFEGVLGGATIQSGRERDGERSGG